jgi:carbon storage regulator CsrA
MLVLTRRRDEEIVIGSRGEIVIKILKVNGNVRVGITAPSTTPIHRREVYEEKRRAQTI